MTRIFATMACAGLFAVTAGAQCFQASGQSIAAQMMPTWVHSVDDEGISPDLALGFTFPMRGVNWTHIAVSSNGVVYLTDGTGAVGDPRFGLASTANLVGVLGDSPRICPFSSDLMASMVSPWDIRVDSSVPGEIKVTWVSVAHYSAGVPTTEDFSMSARLTSNGVVEFAYEGVDYGDPDANDFVAVSAGDGVAGPPSPSDLSTTADSGTHEVIYENGWGLGFDLDGLAISLVSNGNGGFASDRSCRIARHEPFGAGCYDLAREAFYQEFPDASVASATLSGNGILMSPTANGYDVSWNPGLAAALYVPPTPGATLLPVLQANQVTFTPSVGFPTPEGAVTDLTVFGNGIIAFGAAPVQHFGWGPFVPSMFWDPHGGVYFWHIYNEEEGGDVWAEEAGGVIYITFEDVESYPLGTVNPSTWQLQIDQATGAMAMLFVHIDGNNSAVFGAYPQSHLIGFTPPGISQDPGPIDLVADLPMTTMSDVHSLELSATPDPVNTATTGTTIVYSIEHAPEISNGAGVAVGVVAISLSQTTTELTGIGAPGCFAHVGGLDLTLPFGALTGTTPTVSLALPAGIPSHTVITGQAAALVAGANAINLLTSNGLRSVIGPN